MKLSCTAAIFHCNKECVRLVFVPLDESGSPESCDPMNCLLIGLPLMAKIGVLRCQSCGAGLIDGTTSCPRCGAPITSSTRPGSPPRGAPPLHAFVPGGGIADPPARSLETKRMRSVEGGIAVPLVVVGVLLIGSLVAALTLGSSSSTSAQASGSGATSTLPSSTTGVAANSVIGGKWLVNATSTSGSGLMSAEISVGQPQHYTGIMSANGVNLSGCNSVISATNYSRIGVLPLKITLTNTSESSEDAPVINLGGAGSNSNESATMAYAATANSGGTLCYSTRSDPLGCSFSGAIPVGNSGSCSDDIVFTNFYNSDGTRNVAVPASFSISVNTSQQSDSTAFTVDGIRTISGLEPSLDQQDQIWFLPLGSA